MIDVIANMIGLRGLLILAACLLLTAIGLGVAVEIKNARLDAAKSENTALSLKIDAQGSQVAAQNAAIDQMLVNSGMQAERLKSAEGKAARARVITQERIEYVQLASIPVTCPEAVIWGAGHAIEIGKRWEVTNE